MWNAGYSKFFVNPRVKVTYTWSEHYLNKYAAPLFNYMNEHFHLIIDGVPPSTSRSDSLQSGPPESIDCGAVRNDVVNPIFRTIILIILGCLAFSLLMFFSRRVVYYCSCILVKSRSFRDSLSKQSTRISLSRSPINLKIVKDQ
jgi:hypothetical protein